MLVGTVDAPLFPEDVPWERAQAALDEAGLGDGLPLVVPTARRLGAMLAGAGDPDRSLGPMPPLFGDLSVGAVAYCCVLAGCVAAERPLVLAAAAATLEPAFNLLGIQTTTGSPTVCVVAHGEMVDALGMNRGTNCLGPGNRANACVGRAVHLVLTAIGGARPGIADPSTMGQPGKYVFCFAEGRHPLLPSLATRRNVPDADAGAVTVIGVSGTLEVLPEHPGDTPEAVLRAARAAMDAATTAGSMSRGEPGSEGFLLLPPELADLIAHRGWDLAAMQDFVRHPPWGSTGGQRPIARSPADLHVLVAGGDGIKMTLLVPWGGGTTSVTRPVAPLRPGP